MYMGYYDIQKVIKGFKDDNLSEAIKGYDQNDLAYLLREIVQYLDKNEIMEDNSKLIDILQEKVESFDK